MPHRIIAKPREDDRRGDEWSCEADVDAIQSVEVARKSRKKARQARGLTNSPPRSATDRKNVHAQSRNEAKGSLVSCKPFGVTGNSTHDGKTKRMAGAGDDRVKTPLNPFQRSPSLRSDSRKSASKPCPSRKCQCGPVLCHPRSAMARIG